MGVTFFKFCALCCELSGANIGLVGLWIVQSRNVMRWVDGFGVETQRNQCQQDVGRMYAWPD